MKILVAVASKHGSTLEIAEAVTEELRRAGHAAELREAGEVLTLAGYEAVVLGSAVYVGSWLTEARSFAQHHRAALGKLPVWVFSSGPLGEDNPQPHDEPKQLAAPLGEVVIRNHRMFAGKLDKHDLNVGERLIARVVRAPTGDFRDWEEIRSYAREIASALAAPAKVSGWA